MLPTFKFPYPNLRTNHQIETLLKLEVEKKETKPAEPRKSKREMESTETTKKTKLEYFDHMWKLQSKASLLSLLQVEVGRYALILDSTIFYPQGGGQPYDTGYISNTDLNFKFIVEDVRLKDGLVFHYGHVENCDGQCDWKLDKGLEVCLFVDEKRRNLNSRPFVEYKGKVSQVELQNKQKEIELDANALISEGGMVYAAVLTYEEASKLCGGHLPDYISEGSTPRIVKFGNHPGCPCGGTHVADISEIQSLKVPQIRAKKGLVKVFYDVSV